MVEVTVCLGANQTRVAIFAFQNNPIHSGGWFAVLEGDCCSLRFSAPVFGSVKDKVGFFPCLSLAGCVIVAPGSSIPFPRCFHTFLTLHRWAWLFLICAFWLVNGWCVAWLIPDFPCLHLALQRCFEAPAHAVPQSWALTSSPSLWGWIRGFTRFPPVFLSLLTGSSEGGCVCLLRAVEKPGFLQWCHNNTRSEFLGLVFLRSTGTFSLLFVLMKVLWQIYPENPFFFSFLSLLVTSSVTKDVWTVCFYLSSDTKNIIY